MIPQASDIIKKYLLRSGQLSKDPEYNHAMNINFIKSLH